MMKNLKTAIMAMVAAAGMLLATSANASMVTMTANEGGDVLNMSFQVNDTTHDITSISGVITTLTTGGPLAITGLMPMSEYGAVYFFDQKWLPGLDTLGIGIDFGGSFKGNLYQVGADLFWSVSPAGDPDYNPGHILREASFTTVPEPGGLALFGIGAIGLLLSRRKTESIAESLGTA